MASGTFTPVTSYLFHGGLRGTNAGGPIPMAPKTAYSNLGALLGGGLRGTDFQGPTEFTSGINSYTGAKPSAGAQAQVAGGQKFAPPTPDQLSADPILQQIRAAGQQNIDQARQGALANAENALIGYGGTTVPDSVKALYGGDTSNPILAALADSNTAAAAQANPDSTLKQLARTDLGNNAGIDQNENASNLFYSSDRGNKLGDEATNYRVAQNTAADNLGQLLGQANQGVLDAENGANQQYLSGLSDAWNRYLSMAQLLGGSGDAPPPDGAAPPPNPSSFAGGSPHGTAGPGGYVQPNPAVSDFWRKIMGGGTPPSSPSRLY